MYGNDILNNHNILRYGLTIDFCQTFRSLKYMDIELPFVLIRHFHTYIKPFVDKNLKNKAYIKKLQKKHNILTMKDVQKKLMSGHMKRNLSTYSHRKTILMSGVFASFAIDQFSKNNVILMDANHHDKKAIKNALQKKNLPTNITVFDVQRAQNKVVVPKKAKIKLLLQLQKILSANSKHIIFGTKEFEKWMKKHLFRALRWIHTLEFLIRKKPIGLILDHFEITYPGNILSLIAKKYNLPFLLAPQVLISDRTLIPSRATRYLVWGNHYKQWIQKRGIASSKIDVIGNMRFEYDKQQKSYPRAAFIQKLRIPEDHLIITFTSQTFSEKVNLTIMEWILKAVHSKPISVIIKPHPYDSTNYSRFSKHPNINLAPKDMHLYNIIENSDFIMTISSNTGIEAINYGKGIIVLQPRLPYHFENNSNDFNSFLVKGGAGPVAYNENDLTNYFTKLVKEKKFKEAILSQGQTFLSQTMNTKVTPYVEARKIIQDQLKNN